LTLKALCDLDLDLLINDNSAKCTADIKNSRRTILIDQREDTGHFMIQKTMFAINKAVIH